ncbi:PTS sugar transporter subunit IIB [Listeria fleischmannii]|jgi:PTS system cellobiose-specific IIB component|uniref:PTS sugar transporter subunit IIB n=1 Tax=Listeria fleischmannii TaxID=1069827 RepID=UPI001629CC78|nr:PTS sugar transporter subunit IIB [Listeria fleischmannii]MBC1419291.1 PTS sugar transporter subunit IIB [Listeria fleischmannii]
MKKIMLICSAGMSSSLLVKKMLEASSKRGLETEVLAVAEADVHKHVQNTDAVLLAPQVRFLAKNLKRKLEPQGIPVEIIDSIDFGTMDGDKVLDQALHMMQADN